MYIWKIERTDYVDYEENAAHIVIAATQLQAQTLAAAAATSGEGDGSIWFAPTTTVTAIGEAFETVLDADGNELEQTPHVALTSNTGA